VDKETFGTRGHSVTAAPCALGLLNFLTSVGTRTSNNPRRKIEGDSRSKVPPSTGVRPVRRDNTAAAVILSQWRTRR
jgi:hypothetical protein